MSKEYKLIFTINDYSKVKISEDFISLEQFYLNYFPKVRCRNFNSNCITTTKIKLDNGEKIEYSTPISIDDYNELKEKRLSKLLTKERHSIEFDNTLGLYDIYFGEIILKLVCIEFENNEEMNNFIKPDYFDEFTELNVLDISR